MLRGGGVLWGDGAGVSLSVSAFPMYARCALSQWHGLTEKERHQIDVAWEQNNATKLASVGHRLQKNIPLWSVLIPFCPERYLLSIKED